MLIYSYSGYLVNSTVTGNEGDGVSAPHSSEFTTLVISGSTLVNNTGNELALEPIDPPTREAHLGNNLIVGTCQINPLVGITSGGGNLESPGDTCNLGALDLVDVAEPMLGALLWTGGPTPVHRPLPGSPAIDQPLAYATGFPYDQRNLSRPREGDLNPLVLWDVGAVELAGPGEIFVGNFECGFTTGWSAVVD